LETETLFLFQEKIYKIFNFYNLFFKSTILLIQVYLSYALLVDAKVLLFVRNIFFDPSYKNYVS